MNEFVHLTDNVVSPFLWNWYWSPSICCLSFPRTVHSFEVKQIIPEQQNGVL